MLNSLPRSLLQILIYSINWISRINRTNGCIDINVTNRISRTNKFNLMKQRLHIMIGPISPFLVPLDFDPGKIAPHQVILQHCSLINRRIYSPIFIMIRNTVRSMLTFPIVMGFLQCCC